MALVFSDGFDSYSGRTALLNRYRSVGSGWNWQPTAGRFGGGCIQATGSSVSELTAFQDAVAPVGIGGTAAYGFWFKISAPPASSAWILNLLDEDGAFVVGLRVNTLGLIFLMTSEVTSVTNASFNVCDDTWHYFEFATFGTLTESTMFIDNISANSFINTGISGYTTFEWSSIPDRTMTIDDFVAYTNATGAPTPLADFPIGPQLITTLRPAADFEVQFDRSSGASNSNLIREVSANTDNWVQGEGLDVGFQDLYEYNGALVDSPAPDHIHAAVVTALIRNPDVGTVNNALICKSGTVQSDGDAAASPLSRRYRQRAIATDPETAAEWEAARLNSALFGVKVAS